MIKPEDYAFTVEAAGVFWDVYRFVKDTKAGTLAFRERPDGKFEIGLMKAGTLTEAEVREALSSVV